MQQKKKGREKRVTVVIPESLHRRLKTYCAKNDITIREAFINWVEEGINQKKKKALEKS